MLSKKLEKFGMITIWSKNNTILIKSEIIGENKFGSLKIITYICTMNKITKWEDCGRDDLNSIPLMIENGFTVEFSWRDKMHGRTTFDNPPLDAVSFSKDDLHIWRLYNHVDGEIEFNWIKANLIEGHYTNHVKVVNIKNILR